MFKKRQVKTEGQLKRKKLVEDGNEKTESVSPAAVFKKRKTAIVASTTISNTSDEKGSETIDKAPIANKNSLTRNEEATKLNTLNAEIIDKERSAKEIPSSDPDNGNEATYKGLPNHKGTTSFIKPGKLAQNSVKEALGPVKQASNIRTTMLMDYQPDVCKDYKQTGYCGYGDSCKFLHSRDDFKAGWKLNQEWKLKDEHNSDEVAELENIPFKCVICKNDYKLPIITNCGHYFCSSCFMKRIKKTPNCAICGRDTHGVAKTATKLRDILMKQVKDK